MHTDQHGAFAFGDVPAGTYKLVAYDETNGQLATTNNIVVATAVDPAPIKLAVPR